MMHLKERKREKDGRWDFTSGKHGSYHAVGYCGTAGGGHHETEAEAVACFHNYQLTERLRFFEDASSQRRCQVDGCGVWT